MILFSVCYCCPSSGLNDSLKLLSCLWCYKWWCITSLPHCLVKTTRKQSKCRNLYLKGLRHVTSRHVTKCSCKTMRKISNEFYQGELTIIIFLVIFENIASKLEKIGPIFSSCNPFPSLPSVATDDRKQFQCFRIVFINKARPVFVEINWCKDTF